MKKWKKPTKYFYMMPNEVFNLGLDPYEFMILSYMVRRMNSESECWSSFKTMSEDLGFSISTLEDRVATPGHKCYEMADVLAVRDEYRAQTWAMLIQECKASGMSNKDFCALKGVSEKRFYYWQRKFREQEIEVTAPQLVSLPSSPKPFERI